ncbi:hypothetical protein AcV7_000869 [Taiwanofungus camphoratus]|nr:hypothetical protein AcV7_000869 [Antrodia cinnamomea]
MDTSSQRNRRSTTGLLDRYLNSFRGRDTDIDDNIDDSTESLSGGVSLGRGAFLLDVVLIKVGDRKFRIAEENIGEQLEEHPGIHRTGRTGTIRHESYPMHLARREGPRIINCDDHGMTTYSTSSPSPSPVATPGPGLQALSMSFKDNSKERVDVDELFNAYIHADQCGSWS